MKKAGLGSLEQWSWHQACWRSRSIWTTLSDAWFDFQVVLFGAKSWTRCSFWVFSSLGYSMLLFYFGKFNLSSIMPFFFNFSQEFKYVISVPIFHVATSVCALFALCSISRRLEMCVLSEKKKTSSEGLPTKRLWEVGGLSLFVQKIHMIKKEYCRPPNRSDVLSWLFILSVFL